MIQTLNIKNVALIDSATLNFDEKLNVISGETGAGKSITLDSLSFVFGGRADRSLIRSGEKSMSVEAIFSNLSDYHIQLVKDQIGIDCSEELFLSREIDINGKNICKINGELVPIAKVKSICGSLVDIHGQSEHLAILNNDYQLKIVDLFSKSADGLLKELNLEIEKYKEIDQEMKALGGSEMEKQNLIDLYTYQIGEIENADIKENEYDDLTAEKKEMQQFEKINQTLENFLYNCDKSQFEAPAVEKIALSLKYIQSISDVSEHYADMAERVQSLLIELKDINETINDDLNKNIFDQNRYNYIDERLDYLKQLFRKYGGNYDKLIEYYNSIKNSLENLLNSTEKYNELLIKKENILIKINKIQENLSEIRKKSAKLLKNKMENELKTLGMPNAKIDVEFSKIEEPFSSVGFDRVEFMFSSNLGFELKPLNKVVSGGEMSRVMLAYKIIVSEVDEIQTIVFDEIDSGLSGNIATVVAEYMARLSANKQIIAVSHLPQICAMADENIYVSKYSDKSTTRTTAKNLFGDELLKEIARLMGAPENETGVNAGMELKEKSNFYKNNLIKN